MARKISDLLTYLISAFCLQRVNVVSRPVEPSPATILAGCSWGNSASN